MLIWLCRVVRLTCTRAVSCRVVMCRRVAAVEVRVCACVRAVYYVILYTLHMHTLAALLSVRSRCTVLYSSLSITLTRSFAHVYSEI